MDINDWVKAARLHKGWTLRQLGAVVGLTHSAVAHWESGRRLPGHAHIAAISSATAFPMPVQATWAVAGDCPVDESPRTRLSGAEIQQVLNDLADLPPEEARRVILDIGHRAKQARLLRSLLLMHNRLSNQVEDTRLDSKPAAARSLREGTSPGA
jgi:transcriptional regulator with XRE-family HTH domain